MAREDGYKNLVPWKPGQSGNASGRKTGLVTLLREALETVRKGEGVTTDERTLAEDLAAAIVRHAIAGNAQYAKMILDRIEGKAGSQSEEDLAQIMRPIIYLPYAGSDPPPTHYQDKNGKIHEINPLSDDMQAALASHGYTRPDRVRFGEYEVGYDGRDPHLWTEDVVLRGGPPENSG
jgi:hypothetical protein